MVYFIPASQRKIALAAAQADDEPVLVIGGSGTGKGALAKWIHQNSPRAALPSRLQLASAHLRNKSANVKAEELYSSTTSRTIRCRNRWSLLIF